MIQHKLVSAQNHLSLMLESHYLDLVDQHRDQFKSSCGWTSRCGPIGSWLWMNPFVQSVCEFTNLIELVKSPRYDQTSSVHESIGKCTLTAYVTRGCVTLCVALPFTFKSILRQKKNYENSNISPCKNVIFRTSSKRNQNPSGYYNSIASLKFQYKPKYHLSKILI
jgi:hypothetical protein